MHDNTPQISHSEDSYSNLASEREVLEREIEDLRNRHTRLEEGRSPAVPIGIISVILAVVAIVLIFIYPKILE